MNLQAQIKTILVNEIKSLVKEYLGKQANLPESLEENQTLHALYLQALAGSELEHNQMLQIPCTSLNMKPTELLHFMIIFEMENQFQITLGDEEVEEVDEFKTIQQLIEVVSEKINAQS